MTLVTLLVTFAGDKFATPAILVITDNNLSATWLEITCHGSIIYIKHHLSSGHPEKETKHTVWDIDKTPYATPTLLFAVLILVQFRR